MTASLLVVAVAFYLEVSNASVLFSFSVNVLQFLNVFLFFKNNICQLPIEEL